MIHVGEQIRALLHSQGRTVTWFADQLNYTRVNAYNIFKHPSIEVGLLMRISLLLGHDFFKDLSEVYNKGL
jgi:hypothetical protein